MIELVMFDADGVLFDSIESNIAYYNAIFAKVGEPPLDRQEEIRSISYSAEDMFITRSRDDVAKLESMRAIARALDGSTFFNMLKPPFELRPFMLSLRTRYRLGLATNRSATVPALVEHLKLTDIFHAIASVLDRVAPKPAPDILHLCMRRAGATPERSVYVGDSPIDREAALAAGTHFIAVGNRVEHNHRLATIAELPAALELLAGPR
ncbi:MAG TPA: HAD hydrolase-like protein [Candidatus Binataceae bacterium]|nr:HAD hydrolase-like protein [Candidatus Binataceae bacterium]